MTADTFPITTRSRPFFMSYSKYQNHYRNGKEMLQTTPVLSSSFFIICTPKPNPALNSAIQKEYHERLPYSSVNVYCMDIF